MTSTWTPTCAGVVDPFNRQQMTGHGDCVPDNRFVTQPYQFLPGPREFQLRKATPGNFMHIQPWREPTWSFLGTPPSRCPASQPHLPTLYEGQVTERPAYGDTITRQPSQSSAFYEKLKALHQPRPHFVATSQSSGSASQPNHHNTPRDPSSFRIKRKQLPEYHPSSIQAKIPPQPPENYEANSKRPIALSQKFCSPHLESLRQPKPINPRDHGQVPSPICVTISCRPHSGEIQAAIPAASTQTCVACAEDLPAEDFAKIPLTTSCEHSNSACKDCVKQWIEARLDNGTWDQINCLECEEMMHYADVQRHADPDLFQKYDLLAARSWVNNESDFVWCRTQGCGSGQVHEGGENMPRFRCVACKAQFCVVHEVPWHEGETCAAFDRRMNGEEPVMMEVPVNRSMTSQCENSGLSASESPNAFMRSRNDQQDKRLYDEARQCRRIAFAQNARDRNATHAQGQQFPGYMPAPSREWGPQFSAARAAMSVPPPPVQAAMGQRGFEKNFLDERAGGDFDPGHNSGRYGSGGRGSFVRGSRTVCHPTRQATDDLSFVTNFQRRFEREERNNRAEGEDERRRQRPIRAWNELASTDDAAMARALQDSFEREERERIRQRQRDHERRAYQRRKAEEQQGEQTVKANAKQCPKCRWYIQKNDGCNHVSVATVRKLFYGMEADSRVDDVLQV